MTNKTTTFHLRNAEGMNIFVRRWAPAQGQPKAIVVIAHGAAEHSARYGRFAAALNDDGYVVYAPDHRGHGETAGTLDQAGWAGPDGWNGMLRDLKMVVDHAKSEHTGLPIFLFGHSMGSFLAQRAIQLWGNELGGCILSGSSGAMAGLNEMAPMLEMAAQGDAARLPSDAWVQLFSSFNAPFTPRTGFEWLSRDDAEVDKYVADPWCGFVFSNRLVADLITGWVEMWQPENEANIPKTLPLLIFSGEEDPVGGNTQAIQELVRRYAALGIQDMEVIFYPEGRHEMLNEINREFVTEDILNWLDAHTD